MSETDYAARVAKGVALLDEKRPGWERELDLGTLNIRSGEHCVTAQLSGMRRGDQSYLVGMDLLNLTEGNEGSYVAHGFNAEDPQAMDDDEEYDQAKVYDTLNSLWRDVVTERLTAAQSD
jgi:hypothetical protein